MTVLEHCMFTPQKVHNNLQSSGAHRSVPERHFGENRIFIAVSVPELYAFEEPSGWSNVLRTTPPAVLYTRDLEIYGRKISLHLLTFLLVSHKRIFTR